MKPPLRILLVRHGETAWNQRHRFQGKSDVPLNSRGRAQAQALAHALKGEPIVAIYSSPLLRARQTADAVRVFHPRSPMVIEERLAEMDLGDFEGVTRDEFVSKNPELLKAWREDPSSVRLPGGEALGEVQRRALDALDGIVRCHAPGSTLLVSGHNFVNLTLLCHAMKVPLSRMRTLRQGTAALNILLRHEACLEAEVVNDQSHLPTALSASGQSANGSEGHHALPAE